MKRLFLLLTIIVICVSMVSCNTKSPVEDGLTGEDDTTVDRNQPTEDAEIEIRIDYIAEQLGLTDESEVLYGLIGAVAGKQYNNGNVELYQFDENSKAYKDLIDRKTYLIPAAYKDGVVLIFALGIETDEELVDAFNALEF